MTRMSVLAAAAACLLLAGPGAAPAAPARAASSGTMRAAPGDTVYAPRFLPRTRGSADAPVTVYELSDFQCRYCRQVALETYPALDSLYVRTGKVRWVFMHYPKPRAHPHAVRAAEFSVCAGRAGRFWEMHDALFQAQPEWAPLPSADSAFFAIAGELGMDRAALDACLRSGAAAAEIEADAAYPRQLGIGGVPAFVVEDRMIAQGARPLEVFVAALDSVLAARGEDGSMCGATPVCQR